jgi:opacity protein-like surface antigen
VKASRDVAAVWALTVTSAVTAASALTGVAGAQETTTLTSPRWAYEIKGGEFEPDLERYADFYGDPDDGYFSLGVSYRFRDWLELGGEVGQMRDTGIGVLTSTLEPGGSVEYRLRPVHIYTNFIYQRDRQQRFAPYLGVGVAIAGYQQEVDQQPDIDGRTDTGYAARLGLRTLLSSYGPVASRTDGSPYWRAFLVVEVQSLTAEIEDVDLGGQAWELGFRMEFDW